MNDLRKPLAILSEMVQKLKTEDNRPSSKNLFQMISSSKEQLNNENSGNDEISLQLLLLYKLGCFLFVNKSQIMKQLSHSFDSDCDLIYEHNPPLLNKLEFCEDGRPDLDNEDFDLIQKKKLLDQIFVKEHIHGSIKESYAEGLVSSYSKWSLSYNSIYDEYLDDILKLC